METPFAPLGHKATCLVILADPDGVAPVLDAAPPLGFFAP
jgi:hypothetical protein